MACNCVRNSSSILGNWTFLLQLWGESRASAKKEEELSYFLVVTPKNCSSISCRKDKTWVMSLTLLKTVVTCFYNWPLYINVHNREWRIIFNWNWSKSMYACFYSTKTVDSGLLLGGWSGWMGFCSSHSSKRRPLCRERPSNTILFYGGGRWGCADG